MFSEKYVLWNGQMDLKQVTWELKRNTHKEFPEDLESKRRQLWKKFIDKAPNAYDGNIIRMSKFEVDNHTINLETEVVKYSQMLTVSKYNLYDNEWTGQLGVAMVIFDRTRKFVLVGQRAHNNVYRPLFYALPGGISERKDLESTIRVFCLRELKEEIDLDFSDCEMKLIGLIKNLELVGVQLIICVYTNLEVTQDEITVNEEWERGTLKWYETTNLDKLPRNKMLHDLLFFVSMKSINS